MDRPDNQTSFQEDPWRVFRIMSEFVEGFETMSRIGAAVSVFGSSRTPSGDPDYRGEAYLEAGHGTAEIVGWSMSRVKVALAVDVPG